MSHNFYKSFWNIKIMRQGKEIWSIRKRNSLANEGEEAILESFFRLNATYTPATFYIRLCNDVLVETDDLTTITGEPSTNGYAAQEVEASVIGFPTKDIYEGNWMVISDGFFKIEQPSELKTLFLVNEKKNMKRLEKYGEVFYVDL